MKQPRTDHSKIAYFMFVDLVGSSKELNLDKTLIKLKELNRFFNSTVDKDEIKFGTWTGDGFVLGCLGDGGHKIIFEFALKLQETISKYNSNHQDNEIDIRIGLNQGPVKEYQGTISKGKYSVWGPGIINAQRIMDVGASGNILLGETIVESLKSELGDHGNFLDAGIVPVKHGQPIHIYSYYTGQGEKPELYNLPLNEVIKVLGNIDKVIKNYSDLLKNRQQIIDSLAYRGLYEKESLVTLYGDIRNMSNFIFATWFGRYPEIKKYFNDEYDFLITNLTNGKKKEAKIE